MRAPISIVIPTLNSQNTVRKTLASLFEGIEAGIVRELIVVDGGSTDETREIVEECGGKFISSAASRGYQLKKGVNLAKGDFIFALHSDSVLEPGWSEIVKKYFNKDAGYYCKLSFDIIHPLASMTSTWANARSLIFNLPYGDQGLLIPRKLLMENGSYSPIPIMEDVELALRFKGKLFCMPVVITTSSRKYRKNGWLRQGSKNIVRLLRFLLGADPNNLSDDYNPS
ncbi:MAG: glycosyltransferase [Rhodobacteraceae bacterium]|nr:glycosyltransferase [Paracoccaceae bacterium]